MGSKSAPTVQPISTPPPSAPAPVEEATMEEFTDVELDKQKRLATTKGAKSLQIPLGSM